MKPTVRITGTSLLAENVGIISVRVSNKVEKLLKEFGFKVHNDAKRYAPVDTGRLRASITVNWTDSGKNRAEIKGAVTGRNASKADDAVGPPPKAPGFQVVVGTNVVYAESVHDRVPYLLAAFRENQGSYADRLAKQLKGELIL